MEATTIDGGRHRSALHRVCIYTADDRLVEEVAEHVTGALQQGGRGLVIATHPHRVAMIERVLAGGPADVDPVADGRLLAFDAESLLDAFLVDGRVDGRRFRSTVGAIVSRACADGMPLHGFGEMVAILWNRGDVVGAIALEELWNELLEELDFALLCAYPRSALSGLDDLTSISAVCRSHSHVVDTAGAGELDEAPGRAVFLPVPAAVGAARRMVARMLRDTHPADLVGDAQLVVSELATNAVLHARSAFSVSIELVGSAVRIGVRDIHHVAPVARGSGAGSMSGRGLSIVEELATSWGTVASDDGKLVWCELTSPPD